MESEEKEMKYEKPEIEMIPYDQGDIVTVSLCVNNDQIDICLEDLLG